MYMCVCGVGGCFDKYINAATWSFQTKISSSTPAYIHILLL